MVLICGCFLMPLAQGNSTAVPASGANSLPQSSRQVRLSDRLVVNGSNAERFVVPGKCGPEGIVDIQNLMMQSTFEELWAFVPAGAIDRCYWVEIGEETRAESGMTTIRVDWAYLEKLMARFNVLYLYHFHPLVYFARCARQPGCNTFLVPTTTGLVAKKALAINLQFAMPSAEDIYFMSETLWRHNRYHPAGAVMRHRVVSPYGVVEYALSDVGKKRYGQNRGSRMEGLYIKLVAANSLADEHILELVEKHPRDLMAALQGLIASMNSSNLQVSLVPWK